MDWPYPQSPEVASVPSGEQVADSSDCDSEKGVFPLVPAQQQEHENLTEAERTCQRLRETIYKGVQFSSWDEFWPVFDLWSVANRKHVKHFKQGINCFIGHCPAKKIAGVNCPFHIRVIVSKKSGKVTVTQLRNEHTCSAEHHVFRTVWKRRDWLASAISDFQRQAPDKTVNGLKQDLHARYGLDVAYRNVHRGRERGLEHITGDAYMRVPALLDLVDRKEDGAAIVSVENGEAFLTAEIQKDEGDIVIADAPRDEGDIPIADAPRDEGDMPIADAPRDEGDIPIADTPRDEGDILIAGTRKNERDVLIAEAPKGELAIVISEAPKVEGEILIVEASKVEEDILLTEAPKVVEDILIAVARKDDEDILSAETQKDEVDILIAETQKDEGDVLITEAEAIEAQKDKGPTVYTGTDMDAGAVAAYRPPAEVDKKYEFGNANGPTADVRPLRRRGPSSHKCSLCKQPGHHQNTCARRRNKLQTVTSMEN